MTTTSKPDVTDELATVQYRKLTVLEKVQNTVYSILGLHAGVFIVTFFYILIFAGTYRFGSTDYSLAAAWGNLPVTLHVTSWLNWFPVGHGMGLGTWIVDHWDFIQHTYFHYIPAGIVGFAIIGLILGLGAGKELGPPKLVDRLFIKLNEWTRIFPNRYQGYETTAIQYALIPVTMLLSALPGVILGSALIYGGAAVLHALGLNLPDPLTWHIAGLNGHWSRALLAGSVWQPIAIGALGQHFFARYVTLKAGEDQQRYWLEGRLDRAYDACGPVDRYAKVVQTYGFGAPQTLAAQTEVINAVSALPNTAPARWYAPIYKLRYTAMLKARVKIPEHGEQAKIVMPFIFAILIVAVIMGGIWYVWLPKHGFWLP
jgi:hypothetical protein